ncbi:MAG: isochorismatase family protein [Thermoleophilia bacterium]
MTAPGSARVVPAPGDALLIVDVQGDFVTGSLAVPGGAEVIAPLNRAAAGFAARGLPVIATRDWHPDDHVSFHEQGGPWPRHCVAGTPGADSAEGLELPAGTAIVEKADTPAVDVYSPFPDSGFGDALRARGIRRLLVGGLATDYCVRTTVTDALAEGFDVVVLRDAIRAVEVQPGDGDRAEDAMRRAGARFATTEDVAA